MMQPSDLDTEIFPLAANRRSDRPCAADRVPPYSRAAHPKSTPSQISGTHASDSQLGRQDDSTTEAASDAASPGETSTAKGEAVNKPPMVEQLEVASETEAANHHSEHHLTEPENGFGRGDCSYQETDANSEEDKEPGLLPVLRNRNFLALWSGQVFSQLADKVYLVLMIALISSRFQTGDQSISGWVSAIMMAFTIPAVLFGSVAGVFVDRWSKKAVLVVTNLLRGMLVLGIPVLLWLTQDWAAIAGLPVGFGILLGLSFLVSTLTQFFAPAEQAAIPLLVERHHLLSANSLYTTTMMALVIVGFAVGEPLLEIADALTYQLGMATGLGKELVVGGSYAIAGIILLLLRTGEKQPNNQQEPPHVWQDLRDGLQYLGKNQRIRIALIQLVILFSVCAALTVLAVRMAELIPGLKSSQFGFLLAAGGVGMAAGATLLGQFGQRFSHTQLSLYGSIGTAVSLLGLSIFTKHLWIALLLIVLLGAFAALVAIPMQTTIQKETPPELHGKVFGLQNNAINIALTLPLALAGLAETLIGLQAVFLSLAAIAIAGGLLTWYICRTEPESDEFRPSC